MLLLLLACFDPAQEVILCEGTAIDVGLDEETALGTAADALAMAADNSEGDVTVTVEVDSDVATYRDLEPVDPDATCNDSLAVPITLGFSTADGDFAETVKSTLFVRETDVVASAELDPERLTGDWQVASVTDPDPWDDMVLLFANTWGEDEDRETRMQGTLTFEAENEIEDRNNPERDRTERMIVKVLGWPLAD